MKAVYFDNAATTPVRTEVIKSIQTALENCFGNPSSTHSFGRTAKTAVEQARKTIAATLGAHPSEIIFTSGGTEADNMVLKCAVRDLGVKHIVTTTMEHHAVLHTVDESKMFPISLLICIKLTKTFSFKPLNIFSKSKRSGFPLASTAT